MKDEKKNPAVSLRKRYIAGLSIIAFIVVLNQYLMLSSIERSEGYGRVINISGRQRMLSQKIAKESLLLDDCSDTSAIDTKTSKLKESLELFELSHKALTKRNGGFDIKGRNSSEVESLFEELTPHYESLVENAKKLSQIKNPSRADSVEINKVQRIILHSQENFLSMMERITFTYDREAHELLYKTERAQVSLFIVLLSSLAFVLLFIFYPFDKQLTDSFHRLQESMHILNEQATFDGLTKAYNKKSGMVLLRQVFDRCQRTKKRFTLVFADIDKLKSINDTYGHIEGDKLIKQFSEIISKNLRSYDFCIRYGGDEFLVIINSPMSLAEKTLKRIEGSVNDYNNSEKSPWKIIYSTGTEEFLFEKQISLEKLMENADRKMYEEKRRRQALRE